MYESDLDGFLPEDADDNHLSLIDRCKLQQLKISLKRFVDISIIVKKNYLITVIIQLQYIVKLTKKIFIYLTYIFCRTSNISSQIFLEDVWKDNKQLCNNNAVEHILNSVKSLVQNADTSKMKSWKSSLRYLTYTPFLCF